MLIFGGPTGNARPASNTLAVRGAPLAAREDRRSLEFPVYQVENSAALLTGHRRLLSRGRRTPRVSRTVVLLGLVSLLTDVSAEMVSTILPLYLVYTLGFTPLQYGLVDGVYQGASALVRLVSGFTADRSRRHKEVATVGYGLSAVCKLGLVLAGGAFSAIGALVLLDRTGKGIRTAPRDAMISLSSSPATLGTAFGVHRALDTTGAMLGPLVAFGLLAMAPLAFDSVFMVSFCVAVVGVALLVLFVDGRPDQQQGEPALESVPPPSLAEAGRLLRVPGFARLILVGSVLGLATLSDGFLYLALEKRVDFEPSVFPLLFVGTALVYMLLAVPMGRLADRIGRGRVFVGGYALLALLYGVILMPTVGLVDGAAGARAPRRLLRGHGRRADGARQRHVAARPARHLARAARHRHERRAAARLRRSSARSGWRSAWSRRSSASASRWWRPSWSVERRSYRAGRWRRVPEATVTRPRRKLLFALVVLVCAAVAAASIAASAARGPGAGQGKDGPASATQSPTRGALVYRSLDRSRPGRYGRLAWTRAPGRRPTFAAPACERVYYAAGHGLCLSRTGALGASVKVRIVGSDLVPTHQLELPGVPSRARVSPDGRLGAVTAFVTGHSYADPGTFSTRATIIDLVAGRKVADLEDFRVSRDGKPFRSIDFNFWGVTFARDHNTFYATLASGGETYLVRGDLRRRSMVTVQRNAECPSLSPDGTRVVYKKRVGRTGGMAVSRPRPGHRPRDGSGRDARRGRPGRVARRLARALPRGRGPVGGSGRRQRPTHARI